jgi:hypothetical protein
MNEDDDDEIFECDKFDECGLCRNRFTLETCEDCDVGEFFEEEDYDEVDKHFKGRY